MKNIKWNKIRVRISDNVLYENDWNVYELSFKGNDVPRVDQQRVINEGIYGGYEDYFIGMAMTDLCKWTQDDPTGRHPETYNEVFDWRVGRYRSSVSVIDIRQLVEGDVEKYERGRKSKTMPDVR